jgi:hypothetical protein
MGKLKDGLTSLSNLMSQIDTQAIEVCGEFQRLSTASKDAAGMVTEGYIALYMYLFEHFKKKGQSIDAHKMDTVKDLVDPNVVAFIKGIETQRPLAVKLLKERKDYKDNKVADLLANLLKAQESAGNISGMIAKKKKKWLQSKKFKDKIKTYETQLEAMEATAKTMYDEVKMTSTFPFPKPDEPAYKDAIAATTTVDHLVGHVAALKKMQREDFEKANTELSAGTRRIRQTNFAAQVASFKKWAAEADEMEVEGD